MGQSMVYLYKQNHVLFLSILACSEWLVRCFHVVLIFNLENFCDFFLKVFMIILKEVLLAVIIYGNVVCFIHLNVDYLCVERYVLK